MENELSDVHVCGDLFDIPVTDSCVPLLRFNVLFRTFVVFNSWFSAACLTLDETWMQFAASDLYSTFVEKFIILDTCCYRVLSILLTGNGGKVTKT